MLCLCQTDGLKLSVACRHGAGRLVCYGGAFRRAGTDAAVLLLAGLTLGAAGIDGAAVGEQVAGLRLPVRGAADALVGMAVDALARLLGAGLVLVVVLLVRFHILAVAT